MSTRILLPLLVAIAAAILFCEAQQLVALADFDIENSERYGTILSDVAEEALGRSSATAEVVEVEVAAYVRSGGEVRHHTWSMYFEPEQEYFAEEVWGEEPPETTNYEALQAEGDRMVPLHGDPMPPAEHTVAPSPEPAPGATFSAPKELEQSSVTRSRRRPGRRRLAMRQQPSVSVPTGPIAF